MKSVAYQREGAFLRARGKGAINRGFTVSHHHVSAGYLKLYQLSRPLLSGFDCLLIDEAQDCTPGMNIIM